MNDHSNEQGTLIAFLVTKSWWHRIYGIQNGKTWTLWDEGFKAGVQTDTLDDLVITFWPAAYPVFVHPDFVDWFKDHYEFAKSVLIAFDGSSRLELTTEHWQRVFRKDGSENPFESMLDSIKRPE